MTKASDNAIKGPLSKGHCVHGVAMSKHCPNCAEPTEAPAALTDDRIQEEWFYVMDLPINQVEKAKLFARAIERAIQTKGK